MLIECGKCRCRKNAACKNKPAPGLHDVLLNKTYALRNAELCVYGFPGRYGEPWLRVLTGKHFNHGFNPLERKNRDEFRKPVAYFNRVLNVALGFINPNIHRASVS